MSAEQDAGKSGKKLISMIGFGTLIVLTGGYWLVSWLTHDAAGTDSAVNLNGTASSSTMIIEFLSHSWNDHKNILIKLEISFTRQESSPVNDKMRDSLRVTLSAK